MQNQLQQSRILQNQVRADAYANLLNQVKLAYRPNQELDAL